MTLREEFEQEIKSTMGSLAFLFQTSDKHYCNWLEKKVNSNEEFLQKEIDPLEIEKEVMVSQTLDLLDTLDVFQYLTDTQLDKMKISLERIWENGFRAGKIKNK